MQYTSKLAILAVALFGTSALAAPFASFESELEVREADNKLSAREFFDAYLEAREDPSLDARDLEALDLEAREYLEYLEMREVAATSTADQPVPNSPTHSSSSDSQTPPQKPLSTTSQQGDEQYPHFALLQEYQAAAKQRLQDPSSYEDALTNKSSPDHRLAVAIYLHKPGNLQAALANKGSPFHKDARRMARHIKAQAYLKVPGHYKKALRPKHKYHKEAVKQYLSDPEAFEHALSDETARFHRAALKEYLRNPYIRQREINNPDSPFHNDAVIFQEKLDARKRHGKRHGKKHGKKHSSSTTPTATSTTATETPSATHSA